MSHNMWTIFFSISFILRHDNGTENKMEQLRSVLTENKIQWNKETQGQIRRKKRFRWSNLYFNDPRYLQGSIGSHICLPIPVHKRRIRACKQRICAQSWGIKLNYSSDFFHKKNFVRSSHRLWIIDQKYINKISVLTISASRAPSYDPLIVDFMGRDYDDETG